MQTNSKVLQITLPICVIILSIAWSPKIFQLQTMAYIHKTEHIESIPNIEEQGSSSINNSTPEEENKNLSIELNGRNRMTLISSALKLVLTPLIAFLINYLLGVTNIQDPVQSFKQGFKFFGSEADHQMLAMFITNIITSFIGYFFCYLSCSMNLQKICFFVPLLISTPVSICLVLTGACQSILENCQFNSSQEKLQQTIVIGLLLWFSQVFTINIQVFKSQEFLMAREQSLFWLPTYNGISLLGWHSMIKSIFLIIFLVLLSHSDMQFLLTVSLSFRCIDSSIGPILSMVAFVVIKCF